MLESKGTLVDPFCAFCKHNKGIHKGNCEAFPNGIPKDILEGRATHFKSIDGDNGIVFEPIFD